MVWSSMNSKVKKKKAGVSLIIILLLLIGGYNYQDIYKIINNNLASVL